MKEGLCRNLSLRVKEEPIELIMVGMEDDTRGGSRSKRFVFSGASSSLHWMKLANIDLEDHYDKIVAVHAHTSHVDEGDTRMCDPMEKEDLVESCLAVMMVGGDHDLVASPNRKGL